MNRVPAHGFTLVELLVTVVVVAIAASLLTLGLGRTVLAGSDRELERLGLALANAAERAQVTGTAVALERQPEGYRFVELAGSEEWRPAVGDPLLAEHRWSPHMAWEALMIGRSTQATPDRLIFSAYPPQFHLTVRTATGLAIFRGNTLGAVTRVLPGEETP